MVVLIIKITIANYINMNNGNTNLDSEIDKTNLIKFVSWIFVTEDSLFKNLLFKSDQLLKNLELLCGML